MLKSLKILDFQSHQATEVEFDPKLTCLIGPSNAGKTAILRSLYWILRNRPRGSSFIRNTANNAQAILTTTTGTITRSKARTGGDGTYSVNGEELTALGGEVPQQVLDLLGLADINLSDQLSAHFLVLDSPGQIARTISEAARLEKAEAVAKMADAEAKQAKQAIKADGEALGAARSDSKGLSWVEGSRAGLDAVIALEAAVGASRTILAGLNRATGELRDCERRLVGIILPVGAITAVESLGGAIIALTAGRGKEGRLRRMVEELRGAEQALAGSAITRRLAGMVGPLAGIAEDWRRGAKRLNGLLDVLEDLGKTRQQIGELNDKMESLQNDERIMRAELTECPMCGQRLDDKAKARLTQ